MMLFRKYFSVTIPPGPAAFSFPPVLTSSRRIESIDLLRGIVMIIMALDHVRDYFHYDAFFYSPTDLSHTTAVLFFTRWITHFCAPVFIFLAGISAFLSGRKKTKKELSVHLLTRGALLVLIELFIVGIFRTFNPYFPYFNMQVIAAIGICMIALAGLIYLNRWLLLSFALLAITAHNLLDGVHVSGNNIPAFLWSLIHDPNRFSIGHITLTLRYPVLPWIGLMAAGFCLGRIYDPLYDPAKRRGILLFGGIASILCFIILRSGNFYGDAAHWAPRENFLFNVLSFLNVTKYPPSLLYILITIGPAMIFLSLTERPLNGFEKRVVIFGRVAMFYYLAHILLIHVFALAGAVISGFSLEDMILSTPVNEAPQLKGYGFGLAAVYVVWIGLVFILYPLCKSYDRYKTINHSVYKWLSYL